jgi:hypothetical protein
LNKIKIKEAGFGLASFFAEKQETWTGIMYDDRERNDRGANDAEIWYLL